MTNNNVEHDANIFFINACYKRINQFIVFYFFFMRDTYAIKHSMFRDFLNAGTSDTHFLKEKIVIVK